MKIELTAAEAVSMDRLHAQVNELQARLQKLGTKMSEEAMAVIKRNGDFPEQQPDGFRLEVTEDKVFLVLELPPVAEEPEDDGPDESE